MLEVDAPAETAELIAEALILTGACDAAYVIPTGVYLAQGVRYYADMPWWREETSTSTT